MKFSECEKGMQVRCIKAPRGGLNKSLQLGGIYDVVDLEYPGPHFKGRIVLFLFEEECFKAFYPKYFEKA